MWFILVYTIIDNEYASLFFSQTFFFSWSIYEIIHICTAVVDEVKSDHRSKFSNLSNWKEEAWKNQGFNGIRTRDLRDTGAMLYQLSYEATHWAEVTGSNPVEALIFSGFFFQMA